MYNTTKKCYEYVPFQSDRPTLPCQTEKEALAHLRAQICRLVRELDASPIFVCSSEQLLFPLLSRLLLLASEKEQPLPPDSCGLVRLTEVFGGRDPAAVLMDHLQAGNSLADTKEVNLGDCGGSSRLLYHLLRRHLGREMISSAADLQPFCGRLDLSDRKPWEASSATLKIFHSHLPDGQAAYEIDLPSGEVKSSVGDQFSLLQLSTQQSVSSSGTISDEEEGESNSEMGRSSRLKPVQISLLMEKRRGSVDEEIPNQALIQIETHQLYST